MRKVQLAALVLLLGTMVWFAAAPAQAQTDCFGIGCDSFDVCGVASCNTTCLNDGCDCGKCTFDAAWGKIICHCKLIV